MVLEWLKLRVTENIPASPAAMRALKFDIEQRLWPTQERTNEH